MTNEQETGTTLDDQWGAAFAEQGTAPEPAKPKEAPKKEEAKPASFASLKQESNGAVTNLDMILDIPVTLSVEIGRTRMMVKDLLQLGQGAVVELEKLAGEPMEILVNGRLVARGEAVVINEKFGIKLTDIASPSERINKLR
ncbi:MAG: flagellar motor switch protein FliN [Deltaproteobacteria bacterium]|nr:flagellar motor switch protein FliN [Deltaproteobacteria bacterium]